MNPERWRQIEDLYHAALERSREDRRAFLEGACRQDPDLRKEVQSLLAKEEQAGSFLETPVMAGVKPTATLTAEVPSSQAGQFGAYKILSKIGAGGMGEVYRAHDSKLGRDVAIKTLPSAFAKDPERLARFQREARMLASLNHPNVGMIYGLDESDGNHFLVLELVPGETLAERLNRGPMAIDEAIGVCCQVAEALEAAHEKGIVHRDLKPANVKITPEGKVKVLDFGLAKAVRADPAEADTRTAAQIVESTQEGTVLGTAAYMSPEQARGKPLDKRTDIWSFGCLLYELLTGWRAFRGETITDFMAAILTKEPEWDRLPETTPTAVRELLRRCLQKDPQRRLRDIGDARLELDEALGGARSPEPVVPAAAAKQAGRPMVLIGALCLIAGAAVAGGIAWTISGKPQPSQVVRFTIKAGANETLAPWQDVGGMAWSRDGSSLVYMVVREGKRQLYLRRIDELEARAIPGTENARGWPVFSPDAKWLAFWQGFKWKKVPLTGGPPVTMFDAPPGGMNLPSWGPDDTLAFGIPATGTLARTPIAGGAPRNVQIVDPKKKEVGPLGGHFLPGGNSILFTMKPGEVDSFDDYHVAVYSFQTGQRKTLVQGGMGETYLPSGQLVYLRGGTLFAAPFDSSKLTVTAPAVPVFDGVYQNAAVGPPAYAISDSGSLAYAPGGLVAGGRVVAWVDRQGKEEPLPLPPRSYLHPRISPNGKELAIESEGVNHDLFTYDLARGVLTKVSFDGSSHSPLWTPDGKRLTYRSGMPSPFTMWWMPADRSGPAERLLPKGERQGAASWSPDGRTVAFTQYNPGAAGSVFVLDVTGERKPRPFAQSKFDEGSPRFSPDGRWIAYVSNESGRNEIYAQEYPGPGPKIQISTDGGTDPVWKRNGGEIYYRNGDKMMAVSVSLRPPLAPGKPRMLWEGHYNEGLNSMCGAPSASSSNYDVTADGQRFLMVKEGNYDGPPTEIHVVVNWFEEVKRIVAAKKNE